MTIAAAMALAPASAAGAEPYDDGTVIVKYRGDVTAHERSTLLERAGGKRALDELEAVGAHVVAVEGDPAHVAARLAASPRVDYAEPNFLLRSQARPNDPRFNELWGLRNRGQTGGKRGADIAAPRGWRRAGLSEFPSRGGAPVALVDTGIDRAHPDLVERVAACADARQPGGFRVGTCADESGHGTHIAGTIGAAADNGVGVAGVAFNSPLIVCRALGGQEGQETGTVSDVAKCLGWARDQGARVISMAFAGGPSETLRRAVRRAWRKGGRAGAVLVAAAGNYGGYAAAYPAAYQQVISVAATNHRDRRARFSNRHRTVELAAPGVDVLSTFRVGGYQPLSGTSMSTAYVAGVAAQVRGVRPRARASRARDILRRSVDDLGPQGRDPRFGYGRISLAKAVR